jgi:hypothetical protein
VSEIATGRAVPSEAITTATGIVVQRHGCSEADAAEYLIDVAARIGLGLADVLALLIEDAAGTVPGR